MISEAQIQRQIIEVLEAMGAVVFRMNAGKGRHNQRLAPAGTPDLLVIGKHRAFWVEVKAPGGRLSPVQHVFHRRLRDHHQEVIVARSVDDLPVPV